MKHEPTKGMKVAMGYTCTCHQWFHSWSEFNVHLDEHDGEEVNDGD